MTVGGMGFIPERLLMMMMMMMFCVAITPDGQHVVIGSQDMTLEVWDLHTGTCTATLAGHSDWVHSVAIMPDGRHAVSGSDDETLKVWDLRTGTCTATLTGLTGRTQGVAITSDGWHTASLAANELRVWELDSGVCITSIARWPQGARMMPGMPQACVSRQMGGAWCVVVANALSCMYVASLSSRVA